MMLMRKSDGSATAVRRAASTARGWARKRRNRLAGQLQLATLRRRNAISDEPITGGAGVVVSLTSYGARVDSVYATVESIGAGQVRPARVILWLDDADRYADRPDSLRRLEARGLEIRLTDNFGPHTKYFPALAEVVAHGSPLVTADDDILYSRSWLADLLAGHAAHPDEVVCYRANEVVLDGDGVEPYNRWPRCRDTSPSVRHFATGVSGVLYPLAMAKALLERGDAFRETSPKADDVWLHWVALREGVPVRQLSAVPKHFPVIPGTQESGLVVDNVGNSANDRYIDALYDSMDVQRLQMAAH